MNNPFSIFDTPDGPFHVGVNVVAAYRGTWKAYDTLTGGRIVLRAPSNPSFKTFAAIERYGLNSNRNALVEAPNQDGFDSDQATARQIRYAVSVLQNEARSKTADTAAEIEEALKAIDHYCDGPMTPFVAIGRACDLAASGDVSAEAVANALDLVLRSYGWMTNRDDKIVGSARS